MTGITVFSAYITNLSRYNEGVLQGCWMAFPATEEKLQQVLKDIGIDGERYEEYFITDYDCEIVGLSKLFGEYENLNELNYLASLIIESECCDEELEALIELGESTESVAALINLVQNRDCFSYMEGIMDDDDIGRYWLFESDIYEKKSLGLFAEYLDTERFGRDVRIEETGCFTEDGYIYRNGEQFTTYYTGTEDIPEQYCLYEYTRRKGKTQ